MIDRVVVLRPTQHKTGYVGHVPQAKGMEKLTQTQQKHAVTSQNIRITTQNKHKKLKPDLVVSYNIWPGNERAYISALHKFVTYLLKDTYLLTAPDPQRAITSMWHTDTEPQLILCYTYTLHIHHTVKNAIQHHSLHYLVVQRCHSTMRTVL